MVKKVVKSIWETPLEIPMPSSRTKQAFKDEVDINKIVARFTKKNEIDENLIQGFPVDGKHFGDFSDVPDLREMYERIENANESFYRLPSKIRMKFENDPLAFMEFASDVKNLDEMREMGLAHPKPKVVPDVPSVSTPEEREA